MRDFDPNRIASEWHSGQGSALYSYASTDRIPTEEFKERLVSEIERSMVHADDEGLDDLEYLLMHVEEQHPDQYPGSEMHEEDSSDAADMDDKGQWYDASSEKENPAMKEGDAKCENCGGMKVEGMCECMMGESAKMTLSAAIRQIVHEMKLGVAELKDILDGYPDDARVLISSDYGDHCHTEQLAVIRDAGIEAI